MTHPVQVIPAVGKTRNAAPGPLALESRGLRIPRSLRRPPNGLPLEYPYLGRVKAKNGSHGYDTDRKKAVSCCVYERLDPPFHSQDQSPNPSPSHHQTCMGSRWIQDPRGEFQAPADVRRNIRTCWVVKVDHCKLPAAAPK